MSEQKLCSATLRNGEKCQRPVVPTLETCASHRPKSIEAKREAGRKGGHLSGLAKQPVLAGNLGRVSGLRVLLAHAAHQALEGDVRRAGVLCQVVKACLDVMQGRAHEEELDQLRREVAAALGHRETRFQEPQRLEEPLHLEASPTGDPDQTEEPRPTDGQADEESGS